MAPEVILESDVDARADVYALGCVAYYLLTGQLVFEAETPMKMFVQHLQTPPMPPSQRTELPIPAELDELVLACLEKDPANRPQSVEALLNPMNRYRHRAAWDNVSRPRRGGIGTSWNFSGPKQRADTNHHTVGRTTLLSLAASEAHRRPLLELRVLLAGARQRLQIIVGILPETEKIQVSLRVPGRRRRAPTREQGPRYDSG